MAARLMITMFLIFVLGQVTSMIVDWNNIMPASGTAAINAATNVSNAANPFQWSNTISALYNIATWNYSFLTGGWSWLRIIGACFTLTMIWPVLQLLVYAIGGILSSLKSIIPGLH